MELLLWKLAARLVLPLACALILQAAGLLAWATGHRRPALAAIATGWLLLCVASMPGVANPLRADLERRYLPEPIQVVPEASAIVVLSGGLGPPLPPRLFPDLGSAADRVLHAARLYSAGRAPLVIASGGAVPWRSSGMEGAPNIQRLLEEWGVPEEAIIMETSSRNTRENCVQVKRIADRRGLGDVLLVTSALHMRRALATCRSAGLRAIPAPTDYGVVDDRGDDPMAWVPDSTALDNTQQVLREWLGYAFYYARGWITPEGQGPLSQGLEGEVDEPDARALAEHGDAPSQGHQTEGDRQVLEKGSKVHGSP